MCCWCLASGVASMMADPGGGGLFNIDAQELSNREAVAVRRADNSVVVIEKYFLGFMVDRGFVNFHDY